MLLYIQTIRPYTSPLKVIRVNYGIQKDSEINWVCVLLKLNVDDII